ncbi:MAG TPA: PIN domain-containing protein, partial [Thermoanaerobaculia bacterium]|nr:PIN domain-containing protein [Thermoanaerobaculia bacterium]
MKVLVDTSVWSLALRRTSRSGNAGITSALGSLIEDGRVAIIGAIRQELLSGVKERAQLDRLRDYLRAFPDSVITTGDHEDAAGFFNRCREKGIQGSNTDFLICAVAARRGFAIFTADEDFSRFAKILPIALHAR